MGNTPDPVTGKPVYNDTPATQADLQAAVDFAVAYANQVGRPIFLTQAALYATNGTVIGQQAVVTQDPIPANNGGYVWDGAVWSRKRAFLGEVTGPAALTDVNQAGLAVASLTLPVAAGVQYMVSGGGYGLKVSAAGYAAVYLSAGGAEIKRLTGSTNDQIPLNTGMSFWGQKVWTAPAAGSTVFAVVVTSQPFRLQPGAVNLIVEEVG